MERTPTDCEPTNAQVNAAMRVWEELPEDVKVLLRPCVILLAEMRTREYALVIVIANIDHYARIGAELV